MHHVGCMTVLNLTWFRAIPPPEGEGNRYVPPPSRERLAGGWVIDVTIKISAYAEMTHKGMKTGKADS